MNAIRGHAALEARSELRPFSYEPAPLGPNDVEIRITHCGLCHSDLHLIDDAWSSSRYPLLPGHEIVGEVVEKGAAVKHLESGDRVGVGWQRSACLDCELCLGGDENLCPAQQATCAGHPGGLAERIRVDGRFAFPIPDGMPSSIAAPLLCGGITVWAPMRRYGVDATKSVGVIGIGGLGQMAIAMLRAFGCEVCAFSSSPDKAADLLAMGAHRVASSTDPREIRKHAGRFHLLLSTVHARLDWTTYLQTLRPHGVLCLLGLPPGILPVAPSLLVTGQRAIVGSDIGGRAAIGEMLRFAARHRVEPVVETLPMSEVNTAIERLRRNQVRYRMVLEASNDQKGTEWKR